MAREGRPRLSFTSILELARRSPKVLDEAVSITEYDIADLEEEIKTLEEDIDEERARLRRKSVKKMINALGAVVAMTAAGYGLWKSINEKSGKTKEPVEISDTDTETGYKRSEFQKELARMVGPFPPKEITDPKLTQ